MSARLTAQSAAELVLPGHPVEVRVVARERERRSQALVARRRESLVVAVHEVVRSVVDLRDHLVDGTRVVDVDGVAPTSQVLHLLPDRALHGSPPLRWD